MRVLICNNVVNARCVVISCS